VLLKWTRWLTAAFWALLLAAFGYWLTTARELTAVSVAMGALCCLLFAFLGAQGIDAALSSFSGAPETDLEASLGRRSLRRSVRHPVLRLLLTLLAVRLLVYVAAYLMLILQNGPQSGLLETLSLWLKGDAPHYLGIAERWYVTEGDARFHIVFFPLYPIVTRLCSVLFGDTFRSGLVVSAVSTAVGGVLLYELALMDMDKRSALRAVAFSMLLPAAFLYNAPMSDGLFFMLTVLTLFFARKKWYACACATGALASFSRVLGVMLLVPVAVELIGDAARQKRETGRWLSYTWPRALSLLMIPLGLLAYLFINKSVTGDAFTFLRYQKEHWSQGMGFFFNTASYQTNYFLAKFRADPPAALGLWLPNLAFLFGAPLVMLFAGRKKRALPALAEEGGAAAEQPYAIRPSYLAYFLAYYAVGMGATWLLSAPRYLTACFPLSIALSELTRKRGAWAWYVLFFAAQAAYLWAYVAGWPVY